MINEAILFATKAHEGQVRKVNKMAFVLHPLAVGCLLADMDEKEEVIVAGILHDTVEDTEVSLDDIKQSFGKHVADLVDGCSENKALSWQERKEETIEFLKIASEEVCIITCADKVHNISVSVQGIQEKGKEFFKPFNKGYDDQKWYYEKIKDVLGKRIPHHLLYVKYIEVFEEAFVK